MVKGSSVFHTQEKNPPRTEFLIDKTVFVETQMTWNNEMVHVQKVEITCTKDSIQLEMYMGSKHIQLIFQLPGKFLDAPYTGSSDENPVIGLIDVF